jgi:4,5:9,10-diseco-3-hydroxy-5,9,17-trioxoandrosta-1(10),2-diene-4-oate hydrolase
MARRIRHPGLHDAKGNELEHRLVRVAGVDTYVAEGGDGPPVLLIHGYGDTADGWRRVVPGLSRDHRVVAIDMPPFGRSSAPPKGKLLDFYSEFFPTLLDEIELDRASVIGHSLGGAVALRLAIENPERVERLGLVAPAGLGSAPPWWWNALTARPLWQGALSIPSPLTTPLVRLGLRTFLELRLFDNPRRLEEEISHLVHMHGSGRDLKTLLAAGHACIDSYTGELLEQSMSLEIPLWMLWGRGDGLVPSMHARAFERAHPDAKVHVLDDCGHYPHIELPTRFNLLLRRWLDETAPAPRARKRVTAVA